MYLQHIIAICINKAKNSLIIRNFPIVRQKKKSDKREIFFMNKKKETIILGFALFAMFFGAGNLIFPPSLGIAMGKDWFWAGIGFLLTGVGLPLLGVLAFTKVGRLEDFSIKVSPRFNTLYCTILVLVIGPLFAIPRTGSTTFEMGILPSFPNADPLILSIVSSIVFFGITFLVVIRESKLTDIIGKFITPVLLLTLAAITFWGITGNIGTAVDKHVTGVFAQGFVNGYQTMDALASVLFGVIIITGLEAKGITKEKEQRYFLAGSAFIAALGLGLIYFCLMFLGSKVSGAGTFETTSAALYLAEVTLGSIGKIAFGICVATACFTTAVGLVAISADWFSRFTPISYNVWAFIISVFSGVLALGGVDLIIKFSIPVLCILYPVTIILILLNIFGVKNVLVFRAATYTTLITITFEVGAQTLGLTGISEFLKKIPLADVGFVWIIPCILGMIVAYILTQIQNGTKQKAEK